MNLIKERRSVRNFQDKDIDEASVNTILEAVKWTPSWANTQCWEIVVVKDPDTKEKLKDTIAPKNPATKSITGAPVVLALCAKLNSSGYYKDQVTTKFGDWFMFDLGLAAQSISLAAQDMGLGSVIVGLFDHEKAGKILQVPEGYELVVLIPVGYPAKIPTPPKRREISEFMRYDSF